MKGGPIRVATAPITWGVCEVPEWGHQLSPDRVLREMHELGITATEAGPDGFLPGDPEETRALLNRYGLRLVAGFVPVVLHDPDRWSDQRRAAGTRIRALAEAGADVAVVAASTGQDDYEETGGLDDAGWIALGRSVDELVEVATEAGVSLTVHPHYGTMVETPQQVERLLEVTDAPVCLDTGHLLVGGGDPVELARSERVRHVHLKDVDAGMADRVREGDMSYHTAVASGLFTSLGEGDVDVGAIIDALDETNFEGWYVLEQDIVLSAEPPEGGGPRHEAEAGLRYLESVATVRGIA